MHPYVAREIIGQRTREMRDQARNRGLVREATNAGRARHDRAEAAKLTQSIQPRIPDYVDGTFREEEERAHTGA